MSTGLLTKDGRIGKAELYFYADGASSPLTVQGPFWAAVGDGDGTFTDPLNPPPEDANQTGLKHERIRKKYTSKNFVVEDIAGSIIFGPRKFSISGSPTSLVLLEYLFDFGDANFSWREFGFFCGDNAFGYRFQGSQPPVASGIAGVTIDFVTPENGIGNGALVFTAVGTTISWQAPSSPTAGAAIDIGGGGNFTLLDGDDVTKQIRISVNSGTLAGGNVTVNPTLAVPGTVALGGLNSDANPQGQVARNGRLLFLRNIITQVKDASFQKPLRFLDEP